MRKSKAKFPIPLVVWGVIFVIVIYFLCLSWQLMKRLEFFKVKDVIGNQAELGAFSYLKGHNIFSVNLKQEAIQITHLFPAYRKIRLIRVLPNRIFVDFIKRKPIAYLKLYRYFYIDDESVIFESPLNSEDVNLPYIYGLESKISAPSSGVRYNTKELSVALAIIKEVSRERVLKDYRIKKIDVSSLNNVSFFVFSPFVAENVKTKNVSINRPTCIEIKIGQEDLRNKIHILSSLLTNIKNDWNQIKYIDLRFKESVIKFTDIKSK